MAAKKLITMKEAASMLGVTRLTVSNWEKSGKVNSLGVVGRVHVFDASYIQELAKRVVKQHTPFHNRLKSAAEING